MKEIPPSSTTLLVSLYINKACKVINKAIINFLAREIKIEKTKQILKMNHIY